MFEGSIKGISRKFQGCSKKVFDASRKNEGCFNGVLCGFQECLKEVQWVFEGSFQGVSRFFKGSFKVFRDSFNPNFPRGGRNYHPLNAKC